MPAVRLPLALVFGLLFTLTVFAVLSRMVAGSVSPPDLRKIVDVFTVPLRPTPPPPPPPRQPKVEPPKLTPAPGHGIGIEIAEPPRVIDPPPRIARLGALEIEPPRGTVPPSGVDREPIPLVRIDPDYPPRAALAGTEGWVQVQFTITERGTVKDARVVAAEPRSVFDDAALKAIARWRYDPKIDGGVAVERVGLQTIIRFQLVQ